MTDDDTGGIALNHKKFISSVQIFCYAVSMAALMIYYLSLELKVLGIKL